MRTRRVLKPWVKDWVYPILFVAAILAFFYCLPFFGETWRLW